RPGWGHRPLQAADPDESAGSRVGDVREVVLGSVLLPRRVPPAAQPVRSPLARTGGTSAPPAHVPARSGRGDLCPGRPPGGGGRGTPREDAPALVRDHPAPDRGPERFP